MNNFKSKDININCFLLQKMRLPKGSSITFTIPKKKKLDSIDNYHAIIIGLIIALGVALAKVFEEGAKYIFNDLAFINTELIALISTIIGFLGVVLVLFIALYCFKCE